MRTKSIISMVVVMLLMTACGPPKTDQFVEIKPSETAYVIPLEGQTSSQKKFKSIDYLEHHKVATKRIYLPLKKISTGRMWYDYEWVPTVAIITVDRSPITFEWSGDRAIKVESRDSIDFKVGVVISAYIDEADTSKFLYYYPSGDLRKVLQREVYTKATEILSSEFAKYNLEGPTEKDANGNIIDKCDIENHPEFCGARQMKGKIIDDAKEKLNEYFNKKGVTITAFGLIGGMEYTDPNIQKAINDNFKSKLEIINRRNEKIAQDEINAKKISQAIAERKQAEEFAKAAEARKKQVEVEIELIKAQATKIAAEKWDGRLPANILPENSRLMMNFK